MDPIEDAALLQQTIAALEMPDAGLARWLAQQRRFCEDHGGASVYGGLLDVIAACERALERRRAGCA